MGQEGLTSEAWSETVESDEYLAFLKRERKATEQRIRADERTKATSTKRFHDEPIVAYTKRPPSIFAPNPKKEKKTLQQIWDEEDREKREREEQ